MSVQKLFAIPTVIVSLALTFAPVFAQNPESTGTNAGGDNRTAASDRDRNRGPELGWLGLIGLVGLGGLMRRDRDRDARSDRPSRT